MRHTISQVRAAMSIIAYVLYVVLLLIDYLTFRCCLGGPYFALYTTGGKVTSRFRGVLAVKYDTEGPNRRPKRVVNGNR
jgi:hypothetical protein